MAYINSKRFLRNYSYSFTEVKHTPKNIGKFFIIFIPLFVYAWLCIQSNKIDFNINSYLKEKLNNLKAENQKLEAEYQMMTSSKKIEQIACEKYGFRRTLAEEIFIINKSKKDFKNLIFKKLSNDE